MQIKIDGTTSCLAVDHKTSRWAEVRQRAWRQYCTSTGRTWETWTISEYNNGYQLRLRKSNRDSDGFCLDARGSHNGSTLTDSSPGLWNCLGSNHSARDNQTFKFSYVSEGKWKIYSGSNVWLKDAGQHQTFRHDSSSGTTFAIASAPTASRISGDLTQKNVQIKFAGTNDCLDLRYGRNLDGITFQRYACNGTVSQTFYIYSTNLGERIYLMIAGDGNDRFSRCVDTRGDQHNDDLTMSRVHIWGCVSAVPPGPGLQNQVFHIRSAPGGNWHIFAADEIGLWGAYTNSVMRMNGLYYSSFDITEATGGV